MLPELEIGYAPAVKCARSGASQVVSTALDVLRYDLPMYGSSHFLRARALKLVRRTFGADVFLMWARRRARDKGYAAANDGLKGVLDSLPAPQHLVDFLRASKPDVMIISPLTPIGSEQSGFILAARQCGIPSLYSMYSWDNLTNKGMLRPTPDFGLVWNQSHRTEASELHGLDQDRVVLTGAPGYDIWFESQPVRERGEFCRSLGLNPDEPFILYTCSSGSIGGRKEASFVESWLTAIRTSGDARLARAGVLVRPHPQNAQIWETNDLSRYGNVAIYPRAGAIPFSGNAREDFYLSIHHAAAVVGINTSAMIESAIINRPIVAFEDEKFDDGHLGTPHYCELLKHDFMIRTRDLAANISVLSRLVGNDEALLKCSREANARFIDNFIRPLGRDQSATLCWANAVEAVSARATAAVSARPNPTAAWWQVRLALTLGWLHLFVVHPTAKFLRKRVIRRRSFRGLVSGVLRRSGPLYSAAVWGHRMAWCVLNVRRRGLHSVRTLGIFALPIPIPMFVEGKKRRLHALAERGIVARRYHDGEFRLLAEIERAFGVGGTTPDHLILGDSVHYRVRGEDKDGRTLAAMLVDQLGAGRCLALNGSAFPPTLFLEILRCIQRMPHRPRYVVLPINMRCFSPQWHLRNDNQYENEIAALRAHRPGAPIPSLEPTPADLAAFRKISVRYPDSPFETVDDFLKVIDDRAAKASDDSWRSRQIAIFHYMHPLTADHPWLAALQDTVDAAASMGITPLLYVTPLNHMWGARVVGPRFLEVLASNIAIVQSALQPRVQRAGGMFDDLSLSFADKLFFSKNEKTEHLADAGRAELANAIVADLLALAATQDSSNKVKVVAR
ncbi:hypothetical protein BVIR_1974 [Blastochloris viridis]|nr:hypothetical protein BVIR_1974 [Blastochloris viridis]